MQRNSTPSAFPKARGSASNPKNRFETLETVAFDDGWTSDVDDDPPSIATTLLVDHSRSILSHNDSPDVAFDVSINPYRGCEHGCVYCFARPGHAYLGMSAGLDFETKILFKPEAPRLLERELSKPGYRCRTLAIGTNTDPYQPVERRCRIMRGCLEVLSAFRHPVTITTKSHLVTRDIDLLAPMAEQRLAAVSVSVTTLDRELCRKLEPRAAIPAKRLDAIRRLSEVGIPVTVLVAPLIPFITDHEMENILKAAREVGATNAGYILLRLPHEVKDLFVGWLATHFPAKAKHVVSLIRQTRGGKLYEPSFGTRKVGAGQYAELLGQRFDLARRKLGLVRHGFDLDTSQFQRPSKAGDQLNLF